MDRETTTRPDELQVLYGLCHAFGSTPEASHALDSALRWVAQTVGKEAFTANIARPDPAGRLRIVASAGKGSAAGRKRSARRRATFHDKSAFMMSLPATRGDALLLLPMVARGTCLGVLEIQASTQILWERMATLESIASQTAIVMRSIEERTRLKREAEAVAEILDLTADLIASPSPAEAVERVVVYCHRRSRKPTAAWLSDGVGLPFSLIATRGLRGPARASFWDQARELPPRSGLNDDVWRVRAERTATLLGGSHLTWVEAGTAVLAIGGAAGDLEASLSALESILGPIVEHSGAMAAVERRNRGLDTALAWTAHEFRTPLMSAHASLQSLLQKDELGDHANLLNRSSQELSELGDLVESLLRWSVGGSLLRRRRVDLVQLLKAVVNSGSAADRDRVVILGPPSLIIRADPMQLRSALGNLVRNALMYSHPGSKVRVVVLNGGEDASITVVDEGPGVPAEEISTIFDPFVRGRASGRSRKGRGLGLFVAQRVVNAHGGTIWAESTDRGGRFHVQLPVTVARASSSAS